MSRGHQTINGDIFIPWEKWRKSVAKHTAMGMLPKVFPIELHRLHKQQYMTEDEFIRVKDMLMSPDKENRAVGEQILLTLRKKRLRGLR